MTSRSVRLGVLAFACLLITMSGCAGNPNEAHLANGCHLPAHEDVLLAAYLADPIFAVRPPDALAIGKPMVEKGCLDVGARKAVPRGQRTPSATSLAPPPPRCAYSSRSMWASARTS